MGLVDAAVKIPLCFQDCGEEGAESVLVVRWWCQPCAGTRSRRSRRGKKELGVEMINHAGRLFDFHPTLHRVFLLVLWSALLRRSHAYVLYPPPSSFLFFYRRLTLAL
jgi:hypothetical protein